MLIYFIITGSHLKGILIFITINIMIGFHIDVPDSVDSIMKMQINNR